MKTTELQSLAREVLTPDHLAALRVRGLGLVAVADQHLLIERVHTLEGLLDARVGEVKAGMGGIG